MNSEASIWLVDWHIVDVLLLKVRGPMQSPALPIASTGVPTKHATYQIVLPIIYVYCFKGKGRCGRVGLG